MKSLLINWWGKNMEVKLQIKNEQETDKLGLIVAELVFAGFLIVMSGDLGAGKTRFAKSLGKGIGIDKVIKSPTFNILRVYDEGRLPFYHIDAYRLEGMVQDLGFEEFIEGEGVCLIEWYKYLEYMLPNEYLKIDINIISENGREFILSSNSPKYESVIEQVIKQWK